MTADTEKWKAFADELRKWWSFDDGQMHTHSWHDRENFIERKLPSLLAEATADEQEAQQELDAQLCDIAAAGHDEAFAAADRDPALTETQREAIKDRIAARSRTASGLATAIRARQSREQKP